MRFADASAIFLARRRVMWKWHSWGDDRQPGVVLGFHLLHLVTEVLEGFDESAYGNQVHREPDSFQGPVPVDLLALDAVRRLRGQDYQLCGGVDLAVGQWQEQEVRCDACDFFHVFCLVVPDISGFS